MLTTPRISIIGQTMVAVGLVVLASATIASDNSPALPPEIDAATTDGHVPASWSLIRGAIFQELRTTDLLDLAGRLAAEPVPQDPVEIVRRFTIFLLAGYRTHAAAMLDRLDDKTVESWELFDVVSFLADHGEWALVRRMQERYPQLGHMRAYDAINEWIATGEQPAVIDDWLAARAEAEPDLWVPMRMWFRASIGTQEELLQSLEEDCKANPTDGTKARVYLQEVGHAKSPPALDWMGEICRPEFARDSYRIGEMLWARGTPGAACRLLEHSLATPMTWQDVVPTQRVTTQQRDTRSSPDESLLRDMTNRALLKCYGELGYTDKSEKLMAELLQNEGTKESPRRLVDLGRLSGEIGAKRARAHAGDLLQSRESEEGDSPEYWLARARSHIDCGQTKEALDAFIRSLQLAPYEPHRRGKVPASTRCMALNAYWRYLCEINQSDKAYRFLRTELRRAPDGTQSAHRTMAFLLQLHRDSGRPIDPDDDLLWAYFANNTKWRYPARNLLRSMLLETPSEQRDAFWTRVEKLTRNADPTRTLELAEVMLDAGEAVRAIPILQDLAKRADPKRDGPAIAELLFTCHLRVQDWRAAEKIFADSEGREHSRTMAGLRQLATAAGQGGAAEDALRFWKSRAGLDFTDLNGLKELAEMGLRERLQEYYTATMQRAPDSWVPAKALQLLSEEERDDQNVHPGNRRRRGHSRGDR